MQNKLNERHHVWRGWSGDTEKLRRLIKVVEQQATELVVSDGLIASEQAALRLVGSKIQRLVGVNSEAIEVVRNAIEELRADVPLMDVNVELKIRERRSKLTLPSDEGLDHYDRETGEGVKLQAGAYRFGEYIELDMLCDNEYGALIELRVQTADIKRTRSIYTAIRDEVERGVPLWAKLPRPLLGLISAYVVAGGLLAILAALGATREVFLSWLYAALVLGMLGGAFLSFMSPGGPLGWLYPIFRVVADGKTSTSRWTTLLIPLLLSIPVSAIVNLATR